MAASPIRPRWQRIYHQTITLIYKNLLIFYKAPVSTIVRALIFPIVATIVLAELVHIDASSPYSSDDTGVVAASPSHIKDLDAAIKATSSHTLVFVRNGIPSSSLEPIINGVIEEPGMAELDIHVTDDPDDLFTLCKQSLQGHSNCFAAVIFLSFNETNVEYSIALDHAIANSYSSVSANEDSLLTSRALPLQWAVDSHIGNFSSSPKPFQQAWSGYFFSGYTEPEAGAPTNGPVWLALVGMFVGPIFILILIGVVYHLSVFVATERQSSMSELMQAQMVTDTPRILATILSFLIIYFPGFLICSIILTQILFTKTSDILLLFLTLLAGTSVTVSSHFLASFFGKAQLAGLYTSTLAFALALITLAVTLTSSSPYNGVAGGALSVSPTLAQTTALSLIFPPYAWATLIEDVANREYVLHAFSLSPVPPLNATQLEQGMIKQEKMHGYLYVIFFIVQIIVYGAATYGIERKFWGVKRTFDRIDASSDIALRCTSLSKTYHANRAWYWPFKKQGKTVLAVDSLDLEVKKGSVTFLLGPNGGGKTTTLKCVAGMISMDSGSKLELNEAGVVFGICPQQNVFWENLTVEEHIKIWRKLKTAAFNDQTSNDDDDDVLAECDLHEKAKASAKTLSGGQMRKLQLAIAFVGGPKLCCIDEASSGLDPLSRRNIWNIIQKGHSRRTILVTTHFLDEADVLADHIAIVYKGKLVCEGPGPSLKARYGGDYIIRSESGVDGDSMVWRTSNSAEATRKVLELEDLTNDNSYDVVFPTLEQVFLKVTDSNTAIREHTGDGIVGEQETNNIIDEKTFALETADVREIDLDVGHSIGLARQVLTLFRKRYTLMLQKSGWIAYGINLIIPIIIAAALAKFFYKFDSLQTCDMNVQILRNASAKEAAEMVSNGDSSSGQPVFGPLDYGYSSPSFYSNNGENAIVLGPASEFSGPIEEQMFVSEVGPQISFGYDYTTGTPITNATFNEVLDARTLVNSTNSIIATITNSTQPFYGFAIFAPTPETAILYHDSDAYTVSDNMVAFSFITNRIANATVPSGIAKVSSANIRSFRVIKSNVYYLSMPISILIVLAFVAAASIAVIYPAFEKINRVRALHYCNGVSPFALWLGYFLFDLQIILIQAFIVWGLLFAGSLTRLYYESSYILGAFILFGTATYLGTYVLSLYVKKAAFAIAAAIHILLYVLYLVSYILNQSVGNSEDRQAVYSALQYGLGLTSPAANLARALIISMNVFDSLCGKYADADVSRPFAYVRYGSVYANLLIQIIFLITFLMVYEYGSADWFRRNITHRGVPSRLHYIVDDGGAAGQPTTGLIEKSTLISRTAAASSRILSVSNVSKFFGRVFATENISFDINSNETLALLGGNGAGKTTMINLIRGELKPDFGQITLDGINVLRHPHQARVHMGVCPQDDAVDNLTVRQTLAFYASVKGLKNVSGNVDRVMSALNITIYENVMVKALSGGTKRKLSVAIALLGNPRVLLLDEPSTGQDAGAKRILWKALQDISANRAILLTTHSMEEAEALATNVAIMGTKMLATGTLGSLQETYGGLYSVRAVRVPESLVLDVEELIKRKFNGQVSNYEDSHGQISFNLPHEKSQLGSILRIMEELKGDFIEDEEGSDGAAGGSTVAVGEVRVLQDYTISGPTLEEVFMNVARESGIAGGV